MQSYLEKAKWDNDLKEFFKSSAFGIGLVCIVLSIFRKDTSKTDSGSELKEESTGDAKRKPRSKKSKVE